MHKKLTRRPVAAHAFSVAWKIGLGYVVLFFIFLAITWAFSYPLGCQVDEGGPHTCMLLGMDIGGFLYKMGGMALLMVFAAPFFAIVVVGAGVVFLVAWAWAIIARGKN